MIRSIASALAALLFLVGGTTVAQASGQAGVSGDGVQVSEVDGQAASEYEQQVAETLEASSELGQAEMRRLLRSVPRVLERPASRAAFTGERVGWALPNGQFVVADALDDAGLGLSGIAYVFDAAGGFVESSETFSVLTDDGLLVRQWSDGKLAHEELIPPAYFEQFDGGATEPGMTTFSFSFSLSKFNSCLLNAGVSLWVVTVVGAVCGIVGVPTAGVGFVACVVGTLGVASGTAGYCFGYATS